MRAADAAAIDKLAQDALAKNPDLPGLASKYPAIADLGTWAGTGLGTSLLPDLGCSLHEQDA